MKTFNRTFAIGAAIAAAAILAPAAFAQGRHGPPPPRPNNGIQLAADIVNLGRAVIEPRPAQRTGGFSDSSRATGYGSSGRTYPSARPQPRRPGITPPSAAKAQTAPAFALGDKVKHRAFGLGVITKVSPMGGDALLEITFEGVGLKRLMQRAAGQFMTKVEE